MKKFYKTSLLLMLFFFVASIVGVMAQPSKGGTPPSFKTSLADENQPFLVPPPNVQALLAEDIQKANLAPRAAVVLPVDLNPENSGEWITLENGETIWRLAIVSEGARAMLLTYSDFKLPKGSKLFIYNKNKTQVLGAYTEENNPTHGPEFSTELVAGDQLILEYVAPRVATNAGKLDPKTGEIIPGKAPKIAMPTIQIDGIGYAYNERISVTEIYNPSKTPDDLGASGSCMVNINCSQGAQWQNQKKGVVATLQRIINSYYICSGSLINNLRGDLIPYILMAWHCSEEDGNRPTASNYNQWQFYFHWERAGCENTTAPVTYRTMTGCQFQADLALGGGSDGLLLRLNSTISAAWDVYYNGWDASLPTSWTTGGAGIHHPEGDVKKIGIVNGNITQTTAVINGYPNGASNAAWTCSFSPTATEGGSSGSPLFNSAGLIIGTLTGGSSSCSQPSLSNIYGKMGYHFDKLGTDPVMKTFLDPDNTGQRVCPGRYTGTEPIANFTASTQTPYAMQPVQFYSQSFNATSYAWQFPGGNPSTSTEANPMVIYPVPGGPHDVTLTINGGAATKTETGFITVTEKLNDVTIIIGAGTGTANSPLGFANSSGCSHAATLYTAAQLGTAAPFKAIAWYCNTARTYVRTLRVWMEHTTATNVSDVVAWNRNAAPNATATLVAEYTGVTNLVGWNQWTLNKSMFNYNGTQNVIIYVEVVGSANSSNSNSAQCAVRYTATGTNTNRVWTSAYNANPTGTATSNNQVPNIQLVKGYPSELPVANYDGPKKFDPTTSDFKEGFEQTTFPPTTGTYGTWTMSNTNANQAWRRGNPNNGPAFSTIDPTSTYSALCPYANANSMNNQLITPEIDITANNYVIQFWAYYDLIYNNGAHLEFRVATQSGSFTNWTSHWSQGTVTTDADPQWYKITVDMTQYIGQRVKMQWWGTGADGWHMAVDGISLGRFDPLGKYEIYRDEVLNLTDLSTGPPVVWNWQFPGSTTPEVQSFGPVPPAQYEYAGTYDLGLTVTNLKGSNTKYEQEKVIVIDRQPRALFTARTVGGYDAIGEYIDEYHPFILPGGAVSYTNHSENLPDSYVWNFEGGYPASSTNKDVIISYANAGDYTTSLKAKNSAGENTLTEEEFVYSGYGPEVLTNGNFAGSSWGIWTVDDNQYIGGTGVYRHIAERYRGPAIPGQIKSILAYIGGRGTTATTQYTIAIVLPNAAGLPIGTTLYTQTFTLGSLPAAASLPDLYEFVLTSPVNIAAGQAYFIRVTGFTATYNANTFLHFIVSMGDEIDPEDPDEIGQSAWGSDNATVTNATAWTPVSLDFVGDPGVSYALWPQFQYTQIDLNQQLTLPASAGTTVVPVAANITYTANTTNTWYTLTVGATGVTVNYQANATGSPRQGSFTVTGGGATKTVTVLQAADPLALEVTPEEQTIPYQAASLTYQITSNVQWTATPSSPWMVIQNPTGSNNATLNVNTAANMALTARTGIITVTGGGITKTVMLTQEGAPPFLTIDPAGTINVPKMDGSRSIQVTSNVYWFATANQNWINFTEQTGDGNGFVYYNFNANPSNVARTAIITVKAGTLTATLTVIQAAGDGIFTLNPNILELPYTSGTRTVTITTPAPWTVASAPDNWYTIVQTSGGSGTQNITVNYTANNSASSRSSEVIFENGTSYRYLQIEQAGRVTVSWNTPVGGTIQVLNGTTPIANGAIVDIGTELKVVATSNTGYALISLTLNGAAFVNNTSFLVTENTVINAQFEYGHFILTLDPTGGTVSPTSIPVKLNNPVGSQLPTPTRAGYTFDGWYIGTTLITPAFIWNFTSDRTATARWVGSSYTLTLNANGGTGSPASIQVTSGMAIGAQLTNPTRTGYTFDGWFIGTTQITTAYVWNYTSNQTATARWTANQYQLFFNPGLGSVSPTSMYVTYGQAIGNLIPVPTRLGYTYTGWVIGATAINAAYIWNFDGNQTATTSWTANEYTLTLDPSTGSCGTSSIPVKFGSTIVANYPSGLPNATQANCNFLGWYIDATLITNTYTWDYADNKTAVARFSYPITASVAANSTGFGTISPVGTQTYTLGQSATYTCTPIAGYHIVTILVDGVVEFTGNQEVTAIQPYTFTNIGAAHTIVVSFAPNCYAMNPNNAIGAGATVSMSPAGCVPHNSNVTFTFSANCADITGITVGGLIVPPPYNPFTLPAPVTGPLPVIVINTIPTEYTIVASPAAGLDPMGYIDPSGTATVACGSSKTYHFVTPIGYRVKTLLVDGVSKPVPPSKMYTFSDIHSDHTISLEFEEFPYFVISFGPSAAQNLGGIVYPTLFPDAQYYVAVDSGTVTFPFTIQPDPGYVIDKVYVDNTLVPSAVNTGTYTFNNIMSNHSIIATFKPIMFTIMATADPNGGIITPNGAVQVAYNTNQTFNVTPKPGYGIDKIYVDGVVNSTASADGYYTFENVMDNHTINATFTKKSYQITTTTVSAGTISPMNPSVFHGDNQTFYFSPATGYVIDQVKVDNIVVNSANSYTFVNVTAPHELEVTFAKAKFTITATYQGGGDNSFVTPPGVSTVEYDAHSDIYVFVSDEGYHIQSVLIDGMNNAIAVQEGMYRFMNVKANHTIHVIFAKDGYTITATASQGGSISPSGVVTVPYGADKTFFFQAASGNKLVRVLIDGINDDDAVALGQFTFPNIEDDHIISAQFEKKFYDVTYEEVLGAIVVPVDGSVSPVEYGGKYKFSIDLQEGYTQSDITVRANNLIINPVGDVYAINNIATDQYITISGVAHNQYTIVAKAYTGGTITPAGTFIVEYGDNMTFEMFPNVNYKISDVLVNGESVGATPLYLFSDVRENSKIEVYFKVNVGVDVNDLSTITVYSHHNVVTIMNQDMIPVKQVEIMDMYGRLVWSGPAPAPQTDITLDVAKGVYAVRVITEANTSTTTKVTIQ